MSPEKVHGANFSFVYENKNLSFAKRKEPIKWTDDFFGFQLIVSRIEENVIRLFEELSHDFKADKYVLYGELFGGKYPHSNVNPDTNIQAIQTGIYYSPTIEFYAFDIALEFHNTQAKSYLDYQKAISYFEKFNLVHAKILFSGKLNDALNFNIRINSQVPSQLGLPALENNLIEGVVIKPLNHQSVLQQNPRPILKVKNPEFDEEEKFHEAEKWSYTPNVSSHLEELSFLLTDLRKHLTQNRLNSAISKIGAIDLQNEKRMQDIKNEFLRDVLFDFNESNNNILNELSEHQNKWLKARIESDINEPLLP